MPAVPIVKRTVIPQLQGVKWVPMKDEINDGKLVFVTMTNETYEFEMSKGEKETVLKEMTGGIDIVPSTIQIQGGGR